MSSLSTKRPTNRAPFRDDRQQEQESERGADRDEDVGHALGVVEHGLEHREVQRQEDVLHHDDTEDEAGLRIRDRLSSTRSLVAIADDEIPTTPAMISASRSPQPSRKPEAEPDPDVQRQVDRADREEPRTPSTRSPTLNSSPR